MRLILASILALSLAACAAADAKPKAPIAPIPAPLPEFADGADAARVLEAKVAVDAARLRWYAAREEFERKYHIRVDLGDGWDEEDGKLKIRRSEPDPKPAATKAGGRK